MARKSLSRVNVQGRGRRSRPRSDHARLGLAKRGRSQEGHGEERGRHGHVRRSGTLRIQHGSARTGE
eukprot:2078381-Pyramimonas_sp.AAC.1